MSDDFAYHFFFSYASADWPKVEPVVRRLTEAGFRVWAYKRETYVKTDTAIEEAILASRDYVLWVSRAWLGSDWCIRERSGCLSQCTKVPGTKRMFIVVLDREANAAVSQWPLNAADQKNREHLSAELVSPDVVPELGQWLIDRAQVGRAAIGATPIPVAVCAMTRAEADTLKDQLKTHADRLALFERLREYLDRLAPPVDLLATYAAQRDDWRPLAWPEETGGWPAGIGPVCPGAETIRARVAAAFAERNAVTTGRPGPGHFRPEFYSDRLFATKSADRAEARQELKSRFNGCLFVIDPISLLHAGLPGQLAGVIQVLGADQCALTVFPPVGAYVNELTRDVHRLLREFDEFAAWTSHYHDQLAVLADFTATGFHGLRRWLRHVFPALEAWCGPPQTGDRAPVVKAVP